MENNSPDNKINYVELFISKFSEIMKNMGYANLLIAGKTGVGKSTLINTCFREDLADVGIGKPVTDKIRCYEKEGFPLRIYDTVGFELTNFEKCKDEIYSLYEKQIEKGDKNGLIHAMWYCISSEGTRIEQTEIDFVNAISEKIPTIIVLTKSMNKKCAEDLKKIIESKNTKAKNTVILLAENFYYEDDNGKEIILKSFGLDRLIEITFDLIPQAQQTAWINCQKSSLKIKREKAQQIVLLTVAGTFAEGYIPLPFSDFWTIIPTQITMIASITSVYGFPFSKALLTGIVSSIIGTSGTTYLGKLLASNIIKLIPGIGTVVGGAIDGAVAGLLTKALGFAYIKVMDMIYEGKLSKEDFENGKSKEKFKEIYVEELKLLKNRKG